MLSNTANSEDRAPKWLHPNEVLKLQRLKLKKKQLQARINKTNLNSSQTSSAEQNLPAGISAAIKRTNPFIKAPESKRPKLSTDCEESTDQTLFKLFHLSDASNSVNTVANQPTSFSNVLENIQEPEIVECVDIGKSWIPIDWALKSKVRLMSCKPFAWNQKLKISEEASGITGFVRCLDSNSETTLDTSPNAKFHQCCLFWQQPSLPWLNLFPRLTGRTSMGSSIASTAAIRESFQRTWADSLRSLFQLVRTRQCPYFYVCSNTFTVLFRAAGICGYSEMNALITPTTRGFRHLLKQEDIEYTMPLKSKRTSDQGYETLDSTTDTEVNADEDDASDEQWLESMGINAEDIKQINYTQAKIVHRAECEVDNSEQSLVLIKGMEVHALYNFLMNCKSATSTTGPLAGIPPTLLAPIAFHGATLSALKVRESKVRVDDSNYFSLEISGPILPHVIHNLCAIHPSDQSLTATFANFSPTMSFSKLKVSDQFEKENQNTSGFVFGQENLSDCGLNPTILKHFCSSNLEHVCNLESLKYNPEMKTYTWL